MWVRCTPPRSILLNDDERMMVCQLGIQEFTVPAAEGECAFYRYPAVDGKPSTDFPMTFVDVYTTLDAMGDV